MTKWGYSKQPQCFFMKRKNRGRGKVEIEDTHAFVESKDHS